MKSYSQVQPTAEQIGAIAQWSLEAYKEWRKVHTIEERTPKEMFMHGFYVGVLVGMAQEEK